MLGTVLPFTVENHRMGSGPVVTTSEMEGAAYAKGTEAAGDRVAATPATMLSTPATPDPGGVLATTCVALQDTRARGRVPSSAVVCWQSAPA